MSDIVNPNQYAFDVVCNQLLRQWKKSRDEDEYECLLRDPHGRMCALGPFFDDNKARDIDEDAGEALPMGHEIVEKELNLAANLAKLLQVTHDRIPVSGWVLRLRVIAGRYHLSTATLDRLARKYRRV